MQWKRFTQKGHRSIVALWDSNRQAYVDSRATPYGESFDQSYLQAGFEQRQFMLLWIREHIATLPLLDEEGLQQAPSVPTPTKLVCLGKSYADHAREFDGTTPSEPSIFLKAPSAITESSAPVLIPPGCVRLDYEIELAIVIGQRLKNASAAEASQAIAGYTLMCDYSERDFQINHGGQWTKGKSYDSFAPLGPTFITDDEISNPNDLMLELKVNGETRQHDSTKHLIMPIADLVAYVSRFMTLVPGDIISTGTPSGVAVGMPIPRFLQPNDIVEWGSPTFGWNRQVVQQDHS